MDRSMEQYPDAGAQQRPRTANSPMDFTPEEAAALRECGREAAMYRGVPSALFGAGAVAYGVKAGTFSGHPKYGAIPKMLAASFFAYTIGKISYHKVCMAKLMTLPNSALAEKCCKAQGVAYTGWTEQHGTGAASTPEPLQDGYGQQDDHGPIRGQTDYEERRLANRVQQQQLQQQQQQQLEQHREQQRQNLQKLQQPSEPSRNPDYPAPTYPAPVQQSDSTPRQRRNKYGDLVDV